MTRGRERVSRNTGDRRTKTHLVVCPKGVRPMSKIVHENVQVTEPPFVQKLFGSPRWAFIWVLPRLYLGYQWFDASQHKLADPKWVQTGEALKGFWQSVVVTQPKPV